MLPLRLQLAGDEVIHLPLVCLGCLAWSVLLRLHSIFLVLLRLSLRVGGRFLGFSLGIALLARLESLHLPLRLDHLLRQSQVVGDRLRRLLRLCGLLLA